MNWFNNNSRDKSNESNRITNREREKNELIRQIEQLKEENKTLEDQNHETSQLLDDKEKNLELSKSQIEELQTTIKQLEDRISEISLDCEYWKQKFDHLDKEIGRLATFPIRETVEIYNEYMSEVYNESKDFVNKDEFKIWLEEWTNYNIKRLTHLGYRIYKHPRYTQLINEYRCSEPKSTKTGNIDLNGSVDKCELFGVDFPGNQPPLLSSLHVFRYDPNKDPEENAYIAGWEPTPVELYGILIETYRSVDSIDFSPNEIDDQEYDEMDVIDYLNIDMEYAKNAYESIESSITVNADVMNFLFTNNIDSYIRISISLGII